MANNTIAIKRSSVSGKIPNTSAGSIASNSSYILPGELALNMPDKLLYTSNGSEDGLITFGTRRIGTTGLKPNTTHPTDSNYIAAGDIALNMPDKLLFTSNGSSLITFGSRRVTSAPNTTSMANATYIGPGDFAIDITNKKVYSSTGSVAFEIGSAVSDLKSDNIEFKNEARSGTIDTNLLVVNSTTVFVGNATTNTTVNNSLIEIIDPEHSTTVAADTIRISNTTGNIAITPASIAVANNTSNSRLTPSQIFVGNNTVNAQFNVASSSGAFSVTSYSFNSSTGLFTFNLTSDHGFTTPLRGTYVTITNMPGNFAGTFNNLQHEVYSIPSSSSFTLFKQPTINVASSSTTFSAATRASVAVKEIPEVTATGVVLPSITLTISAVAALGVITLSTAAPTTVYVNTPIYVETGGYGGLVSATVYYVGSISADRLTLTLLTTQGGALATTSAYVGTQTVTAHINATNIPINTTLLFSDLKSIDQFGFVGSAPSTGITVNFPYYITALSLSTKTYVTLSTSSGGSDVSFTPGTSYNTGGSSTYNYKFNAIITGIATVVTSAVNPFSTGQTVKIKGLGNDTTNPYLTLDGETPAIIKANTTTVIFKNNPYTAVIPDGMFIDNNGWIGRNSAIVTSDYVTKAVDSTTLSCTAASGYTQYFSRVVFSAKDINGATVSSGTSVGGIIIGKSYYINILGTPTTTSTAMSFTISEASGGTPVTITDISQYTLTGSYRGASINFIKANHGLSNNITISGTINAYANAIISYLCFTPDSYTWVGNSPYVMTTTPTGNAFPTGITLKYQTSNTVIASGFPITAVSQSRTTPPTGPESVVTSSGRLPTRSTQVTLKVPYSAVPGFTQGYITVPAGSFSNYDNDPVYPYITDITAVKASGNVVVACSAGMSVGTRILISGNTGATGLTKGTTYYIKTVATAATTAGFEITLANSTGVSATTTATPQFTIVQTKLNGVVTVNDASGLASDMKIKTSAASLTALYPTNDLHLGGLLYSTNYYISGVSGNDVTLTTDGSTLAPTTVSPSFTITKVFPGGVVEVSNVLVATLAVNQIFTLSSSAVVTGSGLVAGGTYKITAINTTLNTIAIALQTITAGVISYAAAATSSVTISGITTTAGIVTGSVSAGIVKNTQIRIAMTTPTGTQLTGTGTITGTAGGTAGGYNYSTTYTITGIGTADGLLAGQIRLVTDGINGTTGVVAPGAAITGRSLSTYVMVSGATAVVGPQLPTNIAIESKTVKVYYTLLAGINNRTIYVNASGDGSQLSNTTVIASGASSATPTFLTATFSVTGTKVGGILVVAGTLPTDLVVGSQIQLATLGALAAPFVATEYYIVTNISGNEITISDSLAGLPMWTGAANVTTLTSYASFKIVNPATPFGFSGSTTNATAGVLKFVGNTTIQSNTANQVSDSIIQLNSYGPLNATVTTPPNQGGPVFQHQAPPTLNTINYTRATFEITNTFSSGVLQCNNVINGPLLPNTMVAFEIKNNFNDKFGGLSTNTGYYITSVDNGSDPTKPLITIANTRGGSPTTSTTACNFPTAMIGYGHIKLGDNSTPFIYTTANGSAGSSSLSAGDFIVINKIARYTVTPLYTSTTGVDVTSSVMPPTISTFGTAFQVLAATSNSITVTYVDSTYNEFNSANIYSYNLYKYYNNNLAKFLTKGNPNPTAANWAGVSVGLPLSGTTPQTAVYKFFPVVQDDSKLSFNYSTSYTTAKVYTTNSSSFFLLPAAADIVAPKVFNFGSFGTDQNPISLISGSFMYANTDRKIVTTPTGASIGYTSVSTTSASFNATGGSASFVEVANSSAAIKVTPTTFYIGNTTANLFSNSSFLSINASDSLLEISPTYMLLTKAVNGQPDPTQSYYFTNSSCTAIGTSTKYTAFDGAGNQFVRGSSITVTNDLQTTYIDDYSITLSDTESGYTTSITPSQSTLGGTVNIDGPLSVQGTLGLQGQVLTSDGITSYWTDPAVPNTSVEYNFTNSVSITGILTVSNTITYSNASTEYIDGYSNFVKANSTSYSISANTNESMSITPQAISVISNTGTAINILSDSITIGDNLSSATINSTAFSGIANDTTYFGGTTADQYVNTSGDFTLSGSYVFDTGLTTYNVLDIKSVIKADDSVGTAGQVLTTSEVGVYWTDAVNTYSQYAWVNTHTYSDSISVGNTSVNVTINSTSFSGVSLTANNAYYLGAAAAANYVQNTDSRVLSGNLNFTGVNTYFSGIVTHAANLLVSNATLTINGPIIANGAAASGGTKVLSSTGANVYWAAIPGLGGDITVANLTITGAVFANGVGNTGTAGQILTTDGGGNVYWSSIPVINALSQSFTGDGTTTVYTLNTAVGSQKNIIVSINGLVQVPVTHYTISGSTLSFTSAPYPSAIIEARNLESGTGGSGGSGSISSGDLFLGSMLLGGM